jgi:hypothetical protein
MMANVYRVYVTRHYIAVKFYDIEAESEEKAGSLARGRERGKSGFTGTQDSKETVTRCSTDSNGQPVAVG